MKLLKIILPVALFFCFTGCIEINEDVDIKSNGSGQIDLRMDMSSLLDMMQNYLGKEEMEKQLPNKKMDTTIYFKNFTDTAKDLSAEKKALVRDAKANMKLNVDEKVFKTEMNFPFKNQDNLQKLYTAMGDGSIGTSNILKGLNSSKPDTASMENKMQNPPDLTQFNGIYDFKSRDGFISRKVNAEKLKALLANPELSQMKEAGNMGIEIPYTITLKLPRPVKRSVNTFAVLSPDKKTVTIKYNLVEMMDHPEKFEYTIEY